jgi:uncharacterized SAM-dependent methyltransferase
MLYFKNIELAEKYHISLGTVRNWIEAAQNGKLDLVLHNKEEKTYVANTSSNILAIEQLVSERKKYRNTKAVKLVTPRPEFYELFDQEQVYDIVRNLDVYREIPRQYNYFDGGADYWDRYVQRLAKEDSDNILNRTTTLITENQGYLDGRLNKYQSVNVVDVGVGNALPVKGLITHLLEQNKLGKYIAIDISPSMLKIAEKNIKKWFGDKVLFEGHELDISRERFANIIADTYIRNTPKDTANLVLFLGGTLQNFRKRDIPLQVINGSMGTNDFLIHTQKLDTEETRQYFDFNPEPGSTSLSPNHRLIFDLLNIDESFYDVEMGYSASARQRYIRIRLKISLNVKFTFVDGEREISFNKGEAILLLRALQENIFELLSLFDRNDFYVLQSSQTEDQEYILTVSKVKRD